MKTAVEQLADKIQEQLDVFLPGAVLDNKMIEQAKEMEKQQIINAVYHHCSAMSHSDLPCGEQYYNETFKSE